MAPENVGDYLLNGFKKYLWLAVNFKSENICQKGNPQKDTILWFQNYSWLLLFIWMGCRWRDEKENFEKSTLLDAFSDHFFPNFSFF